jgi:hypothetical protein
VLDAQGAVGRDHRVSSIGCVALSVSRRSQSRIHGPGRAPLCWGSRLATWGYGCGQLICLRCVVAGRLEFVFVSAMARF